MVGPWERYQEQAPAEAGPWSQFEGAPTPQPSDGGYFPQIMSGLMEGATGILGAPVDLANAAIGLGTRGVNAAFGTDFQPSPEPLGGSKGLRRGLAISPPSQDTGQQVARRVAQSVGGAAFPVAAGANSVGQVASGLLTAAGGGLGGAAAQQAFPDSPVAEVVGETLGSLGTGAAVSGIANSLARRQAVAAVPETQQLRTQAGALYDSARQNGVTASQQQTQGLARDMRTIASQEGLISPTGRISEAYPKAREAIRLLDDYANGQMTPTQMQTVRKVLTDAAQSVDGPERRIATMMLREFDNFTSPLAPEFAQANALYQRAMKGEQLERMRELGDIRAGQFTASGPENAMRTEYRALDRAITKGQERGWSPAEQQAIQDVSRGTPGQNIARNIGRMAPTGPVSFGFTAGVPFMIGNAMGGPGLGASMAATASGVGYGGRAVANAIQARNIELAELLARNGGQLPTMQNQGVMDAIARALIAEQAMNGVQ